MHAKLTALFEKDGDWWIASIPEIPGVHTQGETLEEAREMLQECLELVLEANRELSDLEPTTGEVVREEVLLKAS